MNKDTITEKLTAPLKAEDIELRVGSVSKYQGKAPTMTLLAYKTARTDVARLNKAVGALGWKREFQYDRHDNLCCKIYLYNSDIKDWVGKGDVGEENKNQSQNGHGAKATYSDAMKRAGFAWGIGIELYSMPTIKITIQDSDIYSTGTNNKGDSTYAYKWGVSGWKVRYVDGSLVVVDNRGNVKFTQEWDFLKEHPEVCESGTTAAARSPQPSVPQNNRQPQPAYAVYENTPPAEPVYQDRNRQEPTQEEYQQYYAQQPAEKFEPYQSNPFPVQREPQQQRVQTISSGDISHIKENYMPDIVQKAIQKLRFGSLEMVSYSERDRLYKELESLREQAALKMHRTRINDVLKNALKVGFDEGYIKASIQEWLGVASTVQCTDPKKLSEFYVYWAKLVTQQRQAA